MRTLHVANTYFEVELAMPRSPPLSHLLAASKIAIQLQYLPLLYADANDSIFVTHLPDQEEIDRLSIMRKMPQLVQVAPQGAKLECWGNSPSVEQFACKARLIHSKVDQELMRTINSKLFTWHNCPRLPRSYLIDRDMELTGKYVLKDPMGAAGRGNRLIDGGLVKFDKILIAEPFVHRLFDFSTQWKVDECIDYLGATRLHNSTKGTYLGTTVGEERELFGYYYSYLLDHLVFAKQFVKRVQSLGYRGYVGLDSMIYLSDNQEVVLHPIVEMNARRTLGLACLEFGKKYYPNKTVHLGWQEKSNRSLLPLRVNGISFEKSFEIIASFP